MSFLEIRSGNRRILGTGGVLTLVAAIIGWFALLFWLSSVLGWPASYGFPCHLVRGCFIAELWHIPALLQRGGVLAALLFVMMWSPYTLLAWTTVTRRLRKRAQPDLSPSSNSRPE